MLLKDFYDLDITSSEVIRQINIVKYCDGIFLSPYFSDRSAHHFGFRPSDCIRFFPKQPSVIMCRFRDGEILNAFDQCEKNPSIPYVLVQTLIGDDGFISEEEAQRVPENVRMIFSKNVHFYHEKISHLPIGGDWRNEEENCVGAFKRSNPYTYQNSAYINFCIDTNPTIRGQVYNKFHALPWITTRNVATHHTGYALTHAEYLQETHRHKFIFSPTGNAFDCYRTWDALYVKSIPVVDKNEHTKMYTDLPIIIVDNWDDVTLEYLEEKYDELTHKDLHIEKMYAAYWGAEFKKYLKN